MSNITLLINDSFKLIKENSLYSSLTIIFSFIISKKIIIPLLFSKSRRSNKSNKFSLLRIEKLLEILIRKKTKNFIFSYLNIGLEKKRKNTYINDNDNDNENNDVNSLDKIQKTKKIIKKLTEEFIKIEQKSRNDKYDSRKDQIFYLLLNNMHVIKENNNNKVNNIKVNFNNNNSYSN
jgi:hypothetical protein